MGLKVTNVLVQNYTYCKFKLKLLLILRNNLRINGGPLLFLN